MKWAQIWMSLKQHGWTWELGVGVIQNWYILPGYSRDTATSRETKFSTENAVVAYLLTTHATKIVEVIK